MHAPPLNPRAYTISQYVSAAAIALLALSAPAQAAVGLIVPGAVLFVFTGMLSLLLILPLLLNLRATPPVTIDAGGITLSPRVGRELSLSWTAVREIKPYPLLPPTDAEAVRRMAAGRKKYSAAEGIMLTSDALPWPYRAVGWFAGEGWRGAFAVTNRSHADYARAKAAIERGLKAAR
jgi:hypothetical protein